MCRELRIRLRERVLLDLFDGMHGLFRLRLDLRKRLLYRMQRGVRRILLGRMRKQLHRLRGTVRRKLHGKLHIELLWDLFCTVLRKRDRNGAGTDF